MREDYLIQIDGAQQMDGEEETLCLSTRGSFARRGNAYYITYQESEATGYEGCTTTVKVEGKEKVTILRYGAQHTQMHMAAGHRSLCHYDTGMGSLVLGISAHEIHNRLQEDEGGELSFSYSLDMNSQVVSHNQVKISVRPF